MCMCFVYSVVSPAVTFQVRPNAHNITTADVANVAGKRIINTTIITNAH